MSETEPALAGVGPRDATDGMGYPPRGADRGTAYAPGFMWGEAAAGISPLGPPHPPSPLAGAHPYLFMILSLYIGWAILLIRGAKDPMAAASLFDWGIFANGCTPC